MQFKAMDDCVASINHVVVKGHAKKRAFRAWSRNSAEQFSKSSFSNVGSLDGLVTFGITTCHTNLPNRVFVAWFAGRS